MYISTVTLLVKDLDRAIDFYTKKLGWEKTMDAPMGDGTRWVTVAPSNAQAAFYLAQRWPDRPDAKAGGSSGVILEVDDVYETQKEFAKKQIEFTEAPRNEPWGGWAMFKDSEGNVHGLHSPAAVTAGKR
jgi:predicted enzyme related to lactoylglutathione lyase